MDSISDDLREHHKMIAPEETVAKQTPRRGVVRGLAITEGGKEERVGDN
uniref:Uncharacterized protein n=1 Tax=Peronospora matthiolae TaxID=2874970 RepID=A0AAV1VER8_9STRA